MNLEAFKNLCRQGKIKWSGHAAARILQRGIGREDVINCIMNGEIIEEYSDFWIGPACLVLGYTVNNKIIHVVAGIDDYVHIVTAYFPDLEKFESDMKTRRRN